MGAWAVGIAGSKEAITAGSATGALGLRACGEMEIVTDDIPERSTVAWNVCKHPSTVSRIVGAAGD